MYISNSVLQIIQRMNPQGQRPDKGRGSRPGQISADPTSCLGEGGAFPPIQRALSGCMKETRS